MIDINKKRNSIEFKVYGRLALFTDPLTRTGGEKSTYHVPTYEALKGVLDAIYWKPTFKWIIDAVRVIKPIKTESKSMKLLIYAKKGSDLAKYSYLVDVEYHVLAHFEWNENRPDLMHDREEHKHHNLAKRYLSKGGRRDVFLGTRECVAYVEPCEFNSGEGYFDGYGELDFGLMFHSFSYPENTNENNLIANLCRIKMIDGVIKFLSPNECSIKRVCSDYVFQKVEVSEERKIFEQEDCE